MRLVGAFVLATLLAACGSSRAAAPKWPKQSERESDGGESLEPRKVVAAAPEKADKDDSDDKADEAAPEQPEPAKADAATDDAASADAPAEPSPDASDDEEITITTEEIVIEIDEDE